MNNPSSYNSELLKYNFVAVKPKICTAGLFSLLLNATYAKLEPLDEWHVLNSPFWMDVSRAGLREDLCSWVRSTKDSLTVVSM